MFWIIFIFYIMVQSAAYKLSSADATLITFYLPFGLANMFVAYLCREAYRKNNIKAGCLSLCLFITAIFNLYFGIYHTFSYVTPVLMDIMIINLYLYAWESLTVIEALLFSWWFYDLHRSSRYTPIPISNFSGRK